MTEDVPEKSAASTRTVEIATSALLLAFGCLIMWDSWRIGAGWGDSGPKSGYFPFYVGLFLNIASAVNLVKALRMQRTESFVSQEKIRLVMAIFLPTLVYVAVLQWAGIYIASAIFIAVFMRWQGKFSILKSVITGVVVSVCLFLMFEIWFQVPLIKGPLEA